ncbi:MAG TPA: hypothetical protein VFX53_04555 [Pedococcus sp.]|nr:hypothetical protein [Pedococcus sp.]
MPAHAAGGYRNPLREFLAWAVSPLAWLVVTVARWVAGRLSRLVFGDAAEPRPAQAARLILLVLTVYTLIYAIIAAFAG